MVLYELEDRKQGILLAEQLRGEGKKVVLLRKQVGNNWEDYLEYAKKNGIHTVYEVKNGKVEEKNF